MILMRMEGIKGDCKLAGFSGWITLTSFSFGAGRKIEAAKKGGGRDLDTGGGEAQDVSISKTIDIATVDLMYQSIKDRSPTGAAGGASPSTVDVVFMAPEEKHDGNDVQVELKPYLKIRFGKALIRSWSIDGDAEGRATESLTLWYNQVAMSYRATPDGHNYQIYGPRGWDQGNHEDYSPGDLKKF